jgi:phage terminase small subunit
MKDSTFKKYCLIIDYWFTNGFNGTQSYLKFYPNSSYESADSSFREIVEIPRIKEYIESKQSKASNDLNITLSKQLKRLNDIIDSDARESDKINAIKEQNKLLALYEEHNRQKNDLSIDNKVSIGFTKK